MLTKKIILLLAVALMLTDLSTQFTPTILSPLPKRRKFKTSEEAMEFLLSLFKTTPKPKQRYLKQTSKLFMTRNLI